MTEYKERVRGYLSEMGLEVVQEGDKTFTVRDPSEGINNLVLFVDDPILILEQAIISDGKIKPGYERELLKRNNSLIHGAFILDKKDRICWKDTLRIESLDLNELEGSIRALSLCMAEHSQYFLDQRA